MAAPSLGGARGAWGAQTPHGTLPFPAPRAGLCKGLCLCNGQILDETAPGGSHGCATAPGQQQHSPAGSFIPFPAAKLPSPTPLLPQVHAQGPPGAFCQAGEKPPRLIPKAAMGHLQKQLIKIKRDRGKLAAGRVPAHGCRAPSLQLSKARALLLQRFCRCQ